jgi:hypothetical protein
VGVDQGPMRVIEDQLKSLIGGGTAGPAAIMDGFSP